MLKCSLLFRLKREVGSPGEVQEQESQRDARKELSGALRRELEPRKWDLLYDGYE